MLGRQKKEEKKSVLIMSNEICSNRDAIEKNRSILFNSHAFRSYSLFPFFVKGEMYRLLFQLHFPAKEVGSGMKKKERSPPIKIM